MIGQIFMNMNIKKIVDILSSVIAAMALSFLKKIRLFFIVPKLSDSSLGFRVQLTDEVLPWVDLLLLIFQIRLLLPLDFGPWKFLIALLGFVGMICSSSFHMRSRSTFGHLIPPIALTSALFFNPSFLCQFHIHFPQEIKFHVAVDANFVILVTLLLQLTGLLSFRESSSDFLL